MPRSDLMTSGLPNSNATLDDKLLSGPLLALNDEADIVGPKSKNIILQKIYQKIAAGMPESIVKNNADGVAKLLSGNFAHVEIEALRLHPSSSRPTGAASHAWRIILQGTGFSDLLNIELLKLVEDGTMQLLLEKYNLTLPARNRACN
ncbi:hypothetical protein BV898_08970 [Hypsibius exemplaris]|uniref:Uncharacterized protein n=1 Tax=Hypsibius exemplaris TaxID=2072580 RepID=A0A1W0WP27_HYPEX|nr:hypothetical protein BV898_08970 [Hypsibius exemplaris]